MTLLVPDYLADKLTKKQKKEKAPASNLEEAYVPKEDLYLDPAKLPEAVIDRLPQPTGWRILILPYQGKKLTAGGIVMPDSVRERESLATVCGYVLRVGTEAYRDYAKFSSGPWCKQGDWVIFGRYAGSRFKIEGGEVRLLNDDEILARISNPDDIVHI